MSALTTAAFYRRRRIAEYLAFRPATEADMTSVEIGSVLSAFKANPYTGWAHGDLVWLENRGLVSRTGISGSNSQCWRITDAGRAWSQGA